MECALNKGYSFCSFDFGGAGLSTGDYLTLGYFQSQDAYQIVQHLSQNYKINGFFLWGRSMGAASALKLMEIHSEMKANCEQKVPQIWGLILDSPYHSLAQLTSELIRKKLSMPQLLIDGIVLMVESTIEQKAKFKLSNMELLPIAKTIKCPVVLLTSKEDNIVHSLHSEKIYSSIGHRDKEIVFIKGDHNQNRDQSTIESVFAFIAKNADKNRIKIKGMNLLIRKTQSYTAMGPRSQRNSETSKVSKSIIFSQTTNLKKEEDLSFTVNPEEQFSAKNKNRINFGEKGSKKLLHIYSPKYTQDTQKKVQHKKVKSSFSNDETSWSFPKKNSQNCNSIQKEIEMDRELMWKNMKKQVLLAPNKIVSISKYESAKHSQKNENELDYLNHKKSNTLEQNKFLMKVRKMNNQQGEGFSSILLPKQNYKNIPGQVPLETALERDQGLKQLVSRKLKRVCLAEYTPRS